MKKNELTMNARLDLFSNSVAFLIAERSMDDVRAVVQSMNMATVKPGELIEPTFSLPRAQVQALFNDLWREGFRPAYGTGNAGHLESVKYHLEDMRRLVFKDGSKS